MNFFCTMCFYSEPSCEFAAFLLRTFISKYQFVMEKQPSTITFNVPTIWFLLIVHPYFETYHNQTIHTIFTTLILLALKILGFQLFHRTHIVRLCIVDQHIHIICRCMPHFSKVSCQIYGPYFVEIIKIPHLMVPKVLFFLLWMSFYWV